MALGLALGLALGIRPAFHQRGLNMHRFVLCLGVLIFLFIAPNETLAQSGRCGLTIAELPELRGFKLGINVVEIRRRHPNFPQPQPDSIGYAQADHHIHYLMSFGEESVIYEPDRKGLSRIQLAFFDGKIVEMKITYDDSVKWIDVGEFITSLSNSLKLPGISAWMEIDPNSRELTCNGNSIRASLESRPDRASISFVQHGIKNVRAERERRFKEDQRQNFKP